MRKAGRPGRKRKHAQVSQRALGAGARWGAAGRPPTGPSHPAARRTCRAGGRLRLPACRGPARLPCVPGHAASRSRPQQPLAGRRAQGQWSGRRGAFPPPRPPVLPPPRGPRPALPVPGGSSVPLGAASVEALLCISSLSGGGPAPPCVPPPCPPPEAAQSSSGCWGLLGTGSGASPGNDTRLPGSRQQLQ